MLYNWYNTGVKGILRSFLINLGAIWATSQILPSLVITGGLKGLIMGVLAFMAANILLVPLIKVLLLPLNLLTLGIFAWLSNVLALYFLVNIIPSFKVYPYHFAGFYSGGFTIPEFDLTVIQVVIVASFIIGCIIHLIHWLIK